MVTEFQGNVAKRTANEKAAELARQEDACSNALKKIVTMLHQGQCEGVPIRWLKPEWTCTQRIVDQLRGAGYKVHVHPGRPDFNQFLEHAFIEKEGEISLE